MLNKVTRFKLIDYIFWILFILFTNPGGIFEALGEDTGKSGIDITDFLFVLIFGCFILIQNGNNRAENNDYRKTIKYLVLFGLYYMFIFGIFVPIFKESTNYNMFLFLKKSRKTIYSILLFIIVYRFYIRSYVVFYKVLLLSSILILSLFFITVFTGLDILPIWKMNRGFINIERIFLSNEGLLYLLVPIGVIVIVFKSNFKWRGIIIIAFVMILLTILLSITRREILGIFIYFMIALMLYNYFEKKALIPIKKLFTVLFLAIVFGTFISFVFPKYLEAGQVAIKDALHVVQYGESLSGKKDVRLGFGKDFMQKTIVKNPLFGTGFDERWHTGIGDKQGYETSDYPLLSAIAMTGVFGLLIFLPIYIVLLKALSFDVKFMRNHDIKYNSFLFFIIILFIIYFIYHILQYINWFYPVSMSRKIDWYVYLAMYFASREVFYKDYFRTKVKLI